jgi:hypothetical protein
VTVPWNARRRRRARWLIVALAVGPPVAALVSFFIVPSQPDDVLLSRPVRGREEAVRIHGVFRNLDAASGAVALHLTFAPEGDLAGPNGPREDLRMLIFGVSSNNSMEFPARTAMQPLTLTVPLTGSRVTRYPFDRYRADLVIAVGDSRGNGVPVVLELSANLNDFRASSTTSPRTARSDGVGFTATFRRNGATLVWSGTLTLLFWSLAAGALGIGWMVFAHNQAVPMWAWGYLAGVLFAEPNLRDGLPGNPPLGSLLDWGAFYWSVAVTGAVLVLFLGSWFQRQRRSVVEAERAVDAATSRATGQVPAVDPERPPG